MDATTTSSAHGIVLRIAGSLDALEAPNLRGVIDDLATGTASNVTVDLSAVFSIDSSGIGAIVSLYKRVRARNGTVVVVGVKRQPLAIFRLLKLDRVFLVEPREQVA